MPTRLAFFGTSAFAVPLLQRLANDPRFTISIVITQPDRPVGRKQVLTPPAVKVAAQELGLPIIQPERMKAPEALEALKTHPFDAAVVASYGQILPQTVLDLAPQKFINLHGSLLPAYRGASPITEAIKQGDAVTGVTVMVMDAAMDHGPTLASAELPLTTTDTTASVSEKLAALGAEMFGDTLTNYLAGTLQAVEQDHAHATLCKLIKKEDALVDPTVQTASHIERLVRAYTPWPLAHLSLAGRSIKLLETHADTSCEGHVPGEIWLEGGKLLMSCTENTVLNLSSVRPEGGGTMTGEAFFRGVKSIPC